MKEIWKGFREIWKIWIKYWTSLKKIQKKYLWRTFKKNRKNDKSYAHILTRPSSFTSFSKELLLLKFCRFKHKNTPIANLRKEMPLDGRSVAKFDVAAFFFLIFMRSFFFFSSFRPTLLQTLRKSKGKLCAVLSGDDWKSFLEVSACEDDRKKKLFPCSLFLRMQ